ncbi:winged helix-turn-helix domain-containing protein [Streptomyces sp. NPDC047315]|uniref:winged helix-turn-helix domain-containing protein n=1 Tax=Streptomyces sp. NPDC047315 TaxID=3155142 RepID=UPI0034064045
MANPAHPRTFSAVQAAAPAANRTVQAPVRPGALPPSARPARHRLRAVSPDEVVPLGTFRSVADFLPPGATWLPAPQHNVPAVAGRPPMVGYLVLVPADQQPAPVAVPAARAAEAGGPVRIDSVERVALVDDRPLDLTYLEFELLAHLVAHPHRVHSRDHLVTTVWGYGHVGDGRTVDVHVARLRRKLGAEHRHSIQTVRRVGYKYAP